MKNEEFDKELCGCVKQDLDEKSDRLDPRIVLKLRAARVRALVDAREERRFHLHWLVPRWLTAGGLATAVVAVVASSLWVYQPTRSLPIQQPEDLEIVTVKEHLDLYQDLEFYRWLAAGEEKSGLSRQKD